MSKREHFKIGDQEHAPKPYHYTECGLINVYLLNGFQLEEYDGDQYVSIDNVEGLWKAIGLNIVTNKKVMTSKEVRYLRTQMDMTQAELAAYLRVDDQTVARWEKGKSKLSGPADVALRALFLSSPVAQPEGGELLSHLMTSINDLIEQDSCEEEDVIFQFQPDDCGWNGRQYAYA